MKKTHKLLFVFAVFAAVALLFAATAMAEETTANPTVNTAGDTVTFMHSIDLINANSDSYYVPDVTFTYSIEPANVNSFTITDISGNVANVKPGPVNSVSFASDAAVTTGSIVFGSEANPADGIQNYSANGTAFTKSTNLYFNLSAFNNVAGVYRYVLTDTTDVDDLFEAGIVRPSSFKNPLFLDVYVENGQNGLKISAARLVTPNDSIVAGENMTTEKTDGFHGDKYYTFDFELSKEVAGTMGDKTHPFPFTITVNNNGLPYFIEDTSEGAEAGAKVEKNDSTPISISLKHGQSFHIYGLSDKATVKVTETNNTNDTYTVTVYGTLGETSTTYNTGTVGVGGTITATITSGGNSITALPVSTYDTVNYASTSGEGGGAGTPGVVSNSPSATASDDLTFENKLDMISPTGLALRYGPFALLLAGAACFFLIGRRRRETEEESDRI